MRKPEEGNIRDTVLALEKAALDRWGKGDPESSIALST